MTKSVIFFVLLILTLGSQGSLAIQCRQCLSVSGDLVSDCFPLKSPTTPQPPTDKPMGSVEIDDDLVANSMTTVQQDETVNDDTGSTEIPPETNSSSFNLCGKTVYYLRRGNWVGRIVALFGLHKNFTDDQRQGKEVAGASVEGSQEQEGEGLDSRSDEIVALPQQQQENDGFCTYYNEDSPLIDEVAANLRLDAFTYLVGVKRCLCDSGDFCNGDPLLRK